MSRQRTGSSLVELLTALPLLGLASALVLLLLVQAAADRRLLAAKQVGARELRHAHAVLAADLAPLRASELRVVSDTLLEVRGQLGLAMVCARDSAGIEVAPAPGRNEPRWLEAVRPGDRLRVWRAPITVTDPPREINLVIGAPTRQLGPGTCASERVAQRWRVPTASASPVALIAGGPLIGQRDVQYLHYRRGSAWWLGRRTRDGATWEIVQPVAGPLESPARRGLRLGGVTTLGVPTAIPDSIAAVAVTLRLPATRSLPSSPRLVLPPDSLRIDIALRAAAWTRGRP